MRRSIFGLSVILLGLLVGACWAFPEPAVLQRPGQWTVDVKFEHPRQITVRLSGQPRPQRFWYIIATVTNNTGHDVGFYPRFELVTDRFEIIPAGKGVRAEVFKRIKRRHRAAYPFLESLEFAGNRILEGPDNAKDIAIIWPDFGPEVKQVKFFLAGFSNETTAIDRPVTKNTAAGPTRVILAKTLELSYAVPGDPAHRAQSKMAFRGKRWVMR